MLSDAGNVAYFILRSSALWLDTVMPVGINISEEHAAAIFRAEVQHCYLTTRHVS
jgi:hypothetical protein